MYQYFFFSLSLSLFSFSFSAFLSPFLPLRVFLESDVCPRDPRKLKKHPNPPKKGKKGEKKYNFLVSKGLCNLIQQPNCGPPGPPRKIFFSFFLFSFAETGLQIDYFYTFRIGFIFTTMKFRDYLKDL